MTINRQALIIAFAPLNRVYLVKFVYDSGAYFTGVPVGCSTGAAPKDGAGVPLWFIVNNVEF
jgi:hypothetical protein